ncbi:MAG: glycosyltransferase family 4 protein [Bacteroidota bacterium]
MRICRIAAVPFSVNKFLSSQIDASISNGYEVLVVTGQDDELESYCQSNHVDYEKVSIERRFSPFKDLYSLFKLIKILNKYDIDCMHTISSKGGLLGSIAARLTGIPCVMHIYAGLPWCEMKGIKRLIGRLSDKLIGRLATVTYTDSFSQRNFIIDQGVCESSKVKVLGQGSVSGFDLEKFDTSHLEDDADIEFKSLGLSENQRVILYVGRVTKEKGVGELISAFERLSKEHLDLSLVLVGPFEEKIDPLDEKTFSVIREHKNIHHVGYKSNPAAYYALAEYLVLPSYREGFGNVVIEAAIAGIPTIGTRIFGLTDSIQDNKTGVLVEPKNTGALYSAMSELITNESLRKELGNNARQRALQYFSKDYINNLLIEEYKYFIK